MDENQPEIGLVTNIKETGVYEFEVLVEDNGTPSLSDKASLKISVEAASPPKILVQSSYNISTLESGYLEIDASKSHSYDNTSLLYSWNATRDSLASYSGIRSNFFGYCQRIGDRLFCDRWVILFNFYEIRKFSNC